MTRMEGSDARDRPQVRDRTTIVLLRILINHRESICWAEMAPKTDGRLTPVPGCLCLA